MARSRKHRKTGHSGSAWRRHFASVAHKCAKLAREGKIRYQDCIKRELRK